MVIVSVGDGVKIVILFMVFFCCFFYVMIGLLVFRGD